MAQGATLPPGPLEAPSGVYGVTYEDIEAMSTCQGVEIVEGMLACSKRSQAKFSKQHVQVANNFQKALKIVSVLRKGSVPSSGDPSNSSDGVDDLLEELGLVEEQSNLEMEMEVDSD